MEMKPLIDVNSLIVLLLLKTNGELNTVLLISHNSSVKTHMNHVLPVKDIGVVL